MQNHVSALSFNESLQKEARRQSLLAAQMDSIAELELWESTHNEINRSQGKKIEYTDGMTDK